MLFPFFVLTFFSTVIMCSLDHDPYYTFCDITIMTQGTTTYKQTYRSTLETNKLYAADALVTFLEHGIMTQLTTERIKERYQETLPDTPLDHFLKPLAAAHYKNQLVDAYLVFQKKIRLQWRKHFPLTSKFSYKLYQTPDLNQMLYVLQVSLFEKLPPVPVLFDILTEAKNSSNIAFYTKYITTVALAEKAYSRLKNHIVQITTPCVAQLFWQNTMK